MTEEEVVEAVVEILKRELTELSEPEMNKCLRIWRDFSRRRKVGSARKPETWAAAVYYIFADISPGLYARISQREASERFGVSEGTVQAKQGEIRDLLRIGFMDERYTPERAIAQFLEGMSPEVRDCLKESLGFEAEPPTPDWLPPEEVDAELYEEFLAIRNGLFEFALEEFGDEVEEAREKFEELDPQRPTNAGFVDWFNLDRESSRGEVPVKLFAREIAGVLPDEALRWVQKWAETEDRMYSVVEVDPESGEMILGDPLTDEFYRVVDYHASKNLEEGKIIVTRLFPWPDAYHMSGDATILSGSLVPISMEFEVDGIEVDPSEVDLMTPLSILLTLFEKARLGEEDELSEIERLKRSLKEVARAVTRLAAGDDSGVRSLLKRYSLAIRMSLERFDLNIDPPERIGEFNEPLSNDIIKEWHDRAETLSDSLKETELGVANALSIFLAKAVALEGDREIRAEDLRQVSHQLVGREKLLKDIFKSIELSGAKSHG
ncbi:hypothetical protein AKJ37_05635 [candidate division MSBL1 archaeon SCGC-AAA259I09]|uniref:DUF6398 domain-containing protein n=1 Tax=candidate division MSBL1 archaeon SCGC-AAA259I09 TaxID=1698267 RepID=A0A133UQ01_9EURY|nr:hypothetical protein AKJ37_05635 [candidate division MSBL1 archaeon SCGC-AAA259I09]